MKGACGGMSEAGKKRHLELIHTAAKAGIYWKKAVPRPHPCGNIVKTAGVPPVAFLGYYGQQGRNCFVALVNLL